jgi:hypothetical protein
MEEISVQIKLKNLLIQERRRKKYENEFQST